MKNLTKLALILSFTALIPANIYVFINSIKLSNSIKEFEISIGRIHRENLTLENKIYDVDSLKFASSMAAQLKFDKKAQPVYLDNLQYARN